jgi:cell division protein FtsB
LVLAGLLVVVVVAVLANASPLRGYVESHQRLEARQAQVTALERETAELKKEVDLLKSGSLVEMLARQELNYVRPGEDMFIVPGVSTTTVTVSPEAAPAAPRGFLERALDVFHGLF